MQAYRGRPLATTNNGPRVSGVHEAPTQPAPYLESESAVDQLIGSIPMEALGAQFQPIVALRSGRTFAFEATPHCEAEGLEDVEELFARATFEKKVGELGRAVRAVAIEECPGMPLFLSVHPHELKDSWLIRPDDPISGHDADVFLQVNQPTYSAVCTHVLAEVSSRGTAQLVLDDFGGGASNLRQIIELAPAFVKLDAFLVQDIEHNERKRRAVMSLVHLCNDLGAQLIAKGIDNQAQLDVLFDIGVPYGQGTLLGDAAALPFLSTFRAQD